MILLNLSGFGTKTSTGHSTRTALSSKDEEAGVPTGEILKHGFWSKESKFEKLHDQVINTQDLIFSYLI